MAIPPSQTLSSLTGYLSQIADKQGPGAVDPYVSTDGVIYGKSYTPVLTPISNTAANLLTSGVCRVTRIGPNVIVSGLIRAGSTLALLTTTKFAMDLPVASDLSQALDLAGAGARTATSLTQTSPVTIKGDPVNNRAVFEFNSTLGAAQDITFLFQYGII